MQRNQTHLGILCCLLLVLTAAGCSKSGVKKGANIPDSVQTESTQTGTAKKKPSRGSQYDTLWDRLFALYALPHIEHPDIDRELNWFANHPAYLERAQTRAEPFLYSIVKLVESKNVPGEIALLPIVESAFQPHVVSPARAAGIWQFIPSTGHNYGLKRSRSYDGRRDVYASTKAAIKYLKKLHGDFGDWLLAIAAYNCGEGGVARAVRRNEAQGLPTDFWSLNLPQETRSYVPKLLAVARLFADAERYGISLKDLPNVARYKPVKVSNQLDLALAADAAGISLNKLYELNPGFKGQIADLDGSFHLYIPAEKKAADFRQEVERLHQERRPFSSAFEGAEEIPIEPSPFESFRREFARQPARGAKDAPEAQESEARSLRRGSEPAPEASATHGGKMHEVQRGETLYAVARKYGTDAATLARLNRIPATTQIQAGQKLMVSEPVVRAQVVERESSDRGSYRRSHASIEKKTYPRHSGSGSSHAQVHSGGKGHHGGEGKSSSHATSSGKHGASGEAAKKKR